MVTMSTVGYGDIYCVTTLGQGFQVLFLLVGLVSIKNWLCKFFFGLLSSFDAGIIVNVDYKMHHIFLSLLLV